MPPSTRSPQPVKALLALRDIRQADLARAVGKSEHFIGRILNGREVPSADLAQAIAEYLDVPAEDLFTDDPDGVVISFVRRTTAASNVPELLTDDVTAERVAQLLRGAQ